MGACLLPDGTSLNMRLDIAGPSLPWLVFSNSLMTDISVWDEQISAFADRWNILRYDQRGHGASSAPQSSVSIDTLGQDLLAVIENAGIGECTYIGLSMGVPTGLAALRQKPDVFKRMIFVDGQARSAATNPAFWQERMEFARANGMAALAEQTVSRWLRRSPMDVTAKAKLQDMIAATPLEGFVACASALRAYDEFPSLTSINIPTHFIAGAEDGALPQTMKALSQAVAGSSFDEIENAGHIPNFEAPADFNRVLSRLLTNAERYRT